MICKLLRTIELLDELQYWLDHWTHANSEKRYFNFERIEGYLLLIGDKESAGIADRARSMSSYLPFKGIEVLGPGIYNAKAIEKLEITP